jgi:hypothetical protein
MIKAIIALSIIVAIAGINLYIHFKHKKKKAVYKDYTLRNKDD